ncbi:N-6 DNA methylase [Xylocopilactobacillus apicola]|uniref:Methylase n=1 Tax=Xylocopilactobacillus apicola TaxID=2932184 RepID=A0AAU9DRH0_9LACO|nr:N-6 DNA methylase [Xylocopilactobacillus apicola]BDR57773.1 methylase [Xylocopilactobacillus apicola]
MEERLIKSAERVKNHGEIFTPKKTVKYMLDQPEIKEKLHSLTATFLEPSAGEGAFLVEILKRKMIYAIGQSHSDKEYGENCLISLSSLYGIEILEDNIEILIMNMIMTFSDIYTTHVRSNFDVKAADKHVLESAKVIIRANMVQGDALKRVKSDGSPIIFSEWKLISGKIRKVQRTEYTFDSIIEDGDPTGTVNGYSEQTSLFGIPEPEEKPKKQYTVVKWTDIYKQKVV